MFFSMNCVTSNDFSIDLTISHEFSWKFVIFFIDFRQKGRGGQGGLRGRERAEEGHEGGHGEDEAGGGPALKMRVPERKGTIFI